MQLITYLNRTNFNSQMWDYYWVARRASTNASLNNGLFFHGERVVKHTCNEKYTLKLETIQNAISCCH